MKTVLALATLALIVTGTIIGTSGTPQTPPVKVYMVDNVAKRVGTKAVDFSWKDGGKTVSFSEVTKGKVCLLYTSDAADE